MLLERFPEISFLLTVSEETPLSPWQDEKGYWHADSRYGALHAEDIEKETVEWKQQLPLKVVQGLYVYGIGLGYGYQALESWLEEDPERFLVFLEEDLSVLSILTTLPVGQRLYAHKQVDVRYVADPSRRGIEALLEEDMRRSLYDRVDFVWLPAYGRRLQKQLKVTRLFLLRQAAIVQASVTELLQYPKLLQNVVSNFLAIESAFDASCLENACQGIPAIVCGAGASLAQVFTQLSSLDNRAVVIAGGSAIVALGTGGVCPHIALALDPNEEEYERLKQSRAFGVPLLYSSRLHKEVMLKISMEYGYIRTDTGGPVEAYLQEALAMGASPIGDDLGMDALSVTTLAVPLARYLGCSPIMLCGVDLCYSEGKRYVSGVVEESRVDVDKQKEQTLSTEKLLLRKNGQGKRVHTLVKWVMEASCLGSYAKRWSDTAFFTSSLEGLPLRSIPFMSIETFCARYCQQEYDIQGKIHAQIAQGYRFVGAKEKVREALVLFFQSARRCLALCNSLAEEFLRKKNAEEENIVSGRASLLEMDLTEELAYQVCLEYIFLGYRRVWNRSSWETSGDKQRFFSRQESYFRACSWKISEVLQLEALIEF